MSRKKRYPNLERARAAKAAKHRANGLSGTRKSWTEKREATGVEFPMDIQIVRHSEEGWVAQGELPIDGGGHFLVQGLGNSPEQALADMRRGFESLPFATRSAR